jgi:putative ABC transport system substrate-binding protein
MRRRDVIAVIAGAAAWPLSARAQQPALRSIGVLGSISGGEYVPFVDGLRRGLRESGHIEGRDVAVEYRWAENQYDRLPALAEELVRLKVAVIAPIGGAPPTLAAKAATATIPIVTTIAADPVKLALIASLDRPGGNITGVALITTEIGPKRLELLQELAPNAVVIGLLVNPNNSDAENQSKNIKMAALALGRQIHVLKANSARDIEAAFAAIVEKRIGALIIGNDAFFNTRREQLVALAARYAVPAIYSYREFAAAGGLMSYAPSLVDAYRQAGIYIGKILKGAKPADLPVAQPTKFELVINLRTAKALGLTVPQTLLVAADEVIE